MAEEKGTWEQLLAMRAQWVQEQPSLGAELKAMAREAIKDVRSTVMETFLGSPEYGGEPGTPLNPTPQQVTQDLGNVYGSYQSQLDSYVARGQQAHEHNKGREIER